MKHALLTGHITFLALAVTIASAQDPVDCPTITVSEYPGVVEIGREYTFSVELSGPVPSSVSFRWDLNKTPIIGAKNAPVVRFAPTEAMQGTSVTATVTVLGLPVHCSNTASGFVGVGPDPIPILLDQFTERIDRISSARLKAFAKDLKNYPSSFGIIFEYFLPPTKSSVITRKIKMTKDQMVKAGVDADRIRVEAIQDAPQVLTLFYRVPPGASNPVP